MHSVPSPCSNPAYFKPSTATHCMTPSRYSLNYIPGLHSGGNVPPWPKQLHSGFPGLLTRPTPVCSSRSQSFQVFPLSLATDVTACSSFLGPFLLSSFSSSSVVLWLEVFGADWHERGARPPPASLISLCSFPLGQALHATNNLSSSRAAQAEQIQSSIMEIYHIALIMIPLCPYRSILLSLSFSPYLLPYFVSHSLLEIIWGFLPSVELNKWTLHPRTGPGCWL